MLKSSGLLLYSLWIIIIPLSPLIGISANFTNVCEIYNSKLNYTFDLNKLIVDNKDVVIAREEQETIRMQLCTPLIEKCNDQDGFAMCVRYKNGTERGVGKFPPRVFNKGGQITFAFPGTACQGYKPTFKNYTVQVILQCDYAAIYSQPRLRNFNQLNCMIQLLWKTALACAPRTYVECTATNNNNHYDLTSLTRYSQNYKMRTENWVTGILILNICHSVIYEPSTLCSTSAGACLQLGIRRRRFINLGNVQSSPVFAKERIILEYQNGDFCKAKNKTSGALLRYRTTITFFCSWSSKNTMPHFIGKDDECHYQVRWNTHVACNRDDIAEYENYKSNDCTVLNPITKSIYDLRPLMNIDYYIQHYNTRYLISVCRPLKNLTCTSGAGVCDTKYHTSLGEANSQLTWELSGPYLYYINGSYCELNKQHSTSIQFFCGPEKLSYQPFIVEDERCYTIIHWNTNLVCEKKRVECITDDDDEINLTSLIQYKKNYIAKYKHLEFHINICRPLVPTHTLSCEQGAAICKVEQDHNSKYVNEVSLGYPVNRPTLNDKQQIVLQYVDGSRCEINPNRLLSANITFSCGSEIQGRPTYIGNIDCTYIFMWSTRLACKTLIGTWIPPCTVINTIVKDEYDLSILYKLKQMYYVKGNLNKKYSINICNREDYCNGFAVCDETNDYGSLTNIIFDYKQKEIKLEYSNGSTCNNDSYTSIIRLVCNESTGIGIPKLLLESECSVQFEWQTGMICAKAIDLENIEGEEESYDNQEMFPEDTEEFISDRVKSVTIITGIMLFVITMFILLTCYQNKFWIKRYIFSWFRRRFDTSEESVIYITERESNETNER